MSVHQDNESRQEPAGAATSWGPWLFRGVLLVTAVYFWWLVIYDHGVSANH